MRLLLLAAALGSALVALATLTYVRHREREYVVTERTTDGLESPIARRASDSYRESEDGVQPWDLPAGWARSHATGLAG